MAGMGVDGVAEVVARREVTPEEARRGLRFTVSFQIPLPLFPYTRILSEIALAFLLSFVYT